MKNNFKPTIFFLILLTLLNAITILVIYWACYHSIDLSDESYYYMGYLHFDNVPDLSGASFHMVFNSFFSSFNMSLPEVRVLRLFLTVLAACILFLGLDKVLIHKNKPEKFLLFNVVLSGMLLSYSWAPLALSYNSMSTILISLIIGVWLLGISAGKAYSQAAYSVIIGSLSIILFFVKITNILLLPIIAVVTLYSLHNKKLLNIEKIKFAIILGCAFLVGAFATLSIYSKGISLIPETVSNYIQESFGIMSGDSSHSAAYLLKRYTNNAEMVVGRLKYPLVLLFASFAIIKLYSINNKKAKKSLYLTLFKLIIGVILFTIVLQNDYWMGGTGSKYIILIVYIFICIAVILNQFLEKKKVDFILLLGLLSIPIIGAIGTNNGLSAQILFYGVFIFLIIHYFVHFSENIWYKYSVLSIIVLLSTSQLISGVVFHPYRQAKLTKSVNKLEGLNTLKYLKVNNETLKIREELAFLDNVEANYIFSYSFMRGMALLANKKPYSLSWFDEKMVEKMCIAVSKSRIEPKDIIFLIPSEIPLENKVIECLENNGVLFNKNYFLIKKFLYYDHRVKKELTLNIYVPSLELDKMESKKQK